MPNSPSDWASCPIGCRAAKNPNCRCFARRSLAEKCRTPCDTTRARAQAACSCYAHCTLWADSRALFTAGSNRPIKIPMIAITTKSSTSVKPAARGPTARRRLRQDHMLFPQMQLTRNLAPSHWRSTRRARQPLRDCSHCAAWGILLQPFLRPTSVSGCDRSSMREPRRPPRAPAIQLTTSVDFFCGLTLSIWSNGLRAQNQS